ncbi:MAG: hypothetical protein ABI255_07435 [Microbacteriaceae bacterium]
MITRSPDTVVIWLSDGIPARLVWAGARYTVTDTPTPLEDFVMGITHPPAIDGWRFQGTGDDGESHMFDVRSRDTVSRHDHDTDPCDDTDSREGSGDWEIVRVYD